MEIWTAFTIGFIGSFHCIGMCGPIAMALPGKQSSRLVFVAGRTLYNTGRIVTYAFLGASFGLFGHSMALAGLQKSLSLVLGILIIANVLISSSISSRFQEVTRLNKAFDYLKAMLQTQFKKSGMYTLFTIGLLNGLLPCGLVYMGLAGSLTTGSVGSGMLYMMFFGLGTIPAMFIMSVTPHLFKARIRRRINKVIPVLAILFGVFLIYRGTFMKMSH